MKKILIRIVGLLVTLIVILNIEEYFSGINQEKINECIEEYCNNKNGEIKIFSFKDLGEDKYGMITGKYILLDFTSYYRDGNRILSDSTQVTPVKFKIISLFGHYKIIWDTTPGDGDFYRNSLEKMFPKDILDDLDKNYSEYMQELSESNKKKLEEEMSQH